MTKDLERAYRPIDDYAIIGNCRSVALVSKEGSIDWLCWPRFDSPSVFAAILDRRRGGCFAVQPVEPFTAVRRYIEQTNVLETTFTTATGTVQVTDLMPVAAEEDRQFELEPEHEILRAIKCTGGAVRVEVRCDARPNFGRLMPRLADCGPLGFLYEDGPRVYVLRSEIPLRRQASDTVLTGHALMKAGDERYISMSFANGQPAVIPCLGAQAKLRMRRSVEWWRGWASHCTYDGPHRDMVLRSALVLKALAYSPSGAIVAAPTTSLPEWIGGVRNWDYRYCWLRDASMTLRAFLELGFSTEAEAFLTWLLHATRLIWPQLQIVYDVFGEARLPETELPHLEGYAGSRPVRIGNAAANQFQIDSYGEVIDGAYRFIRAGGRIDRATARVLVGWGKTVCRLWREPDEGIWEIRAGRRHHTLSKAMCWIALDRLLKLQDEGLLEAPPQCRFECEAVRREIEMRGYNTRIESYVNVLDGDEVDASLLLLSLYGYADHQSARMRSTCERIWRELGAGSLLYRYRNGQDGLPSGQGAFGICSFWGVECRAHHGQGAEARADFERLCSYANDVGLFAEEIDPDAGNALGNFPQAFTHVGLINAALTLANCETGGRAI